MANQATTARRQATPSQSQATPSLNGNNESTSATPLGSAHAFPPPLQRRQPERLAFTRAELAELTGLCERTIRNHETPRGKLRFIRIGERGKRYLASDVEAWLESLRGEEPQSEYAP